MIFIPVAFIIPQGLLNAWGIPDASSAKSTKKTFKRTRFRKPTAATTSPAPAFTAASNAPFNAIQPHLFGGRTASQLLLISQKPQKKQSNGYNTLGNDKGLKTVSELFLSSISAPKTRKDKVPEKKDIRIRYYTKNDTRFVTCDHSNLTPSALSLANKKQDKKSGKSSLYAGFTASQLLVQNQKYSLKENNNKLQDTPILRPTSSELELRYLDHARREKVRSQRLRLKRANERIRDQEIQKTSSQLFALSKGTKKIAESKAITKNKPKNDIKETIKTQVKNSTLERDKTLLKHLKNTKEYDMKGLTSSQLFSQMQSNDKGYREQKASDKKKEKNIKKRFEQLGSNGNLLPLLWGA